MKLSRTLVIERLESKLTAERKARQKKGADANRRSIRALRAFRRINLSGSPTYDQLSRAGNLLNEAARYHEDSKWFGSQLDSKSHYERQIERELELLKLSTDAEVTVRNNSSLADFLTN